MACNRPPPIIASLHEKGDENMNKLLAISGVFITEGCVQPFLYMD